MPRRLLPLVCGLLLAAPRANAQTTTPTNQLAGYRAILFTPAGALPQVVMVHRMLQSRSRAGISLRYGRYSLRGFDTPFNNLGLSAWFGLGPRLQVGATVGQRTCGLCEGLRMGSIDVGTTLFHRPAAANTGGDTEVGLQLSAGKGKAKSSPVSATSLYLSAPLAVTLPQDQGSLLSLFLSPSVAYGSLSEPDAVTGAQTSRGAARLLIGAGISYVLDVGLALHVEAHRVLIKDSPTQLGVALGYTFGRAGY